MNILKKKFLIFLFIVSIEGQENQFNLSFLTTPKTDIIALNSKFKGISGNNFILIPEYSYTNNSFTFLSKSFISRDNSEIDKLFVSYESSHWKLTFGKFLRDITSENSKFSSGSLIESDNSFKPWRINISSDLSINNLLIKGDFSHGILDKSSTYLSDPYIHEKSLYANYSKNNSKFTFGIVHNAIWGGKVDGWGDLGSTLEDWLDVIVGDPGNETKPEGEQINSLGDSFGIFDFAYQIKKDKKYLRFYHQHFFEDNSGLKFENLEDGLYGIEFSNETMVLLIEYLNTKNQSGATHPPGLDSYYWNLIYSDGWTYNNRMIANPYVHPNQNRVVLNYYFFQKTFENISLDLSHINHKIFKSYNGTNNDEPFDLSNDFQKENQHFLIGFKTSFKNIDFRILTDVESQDTMISLNTFF